MLTAAAIAAVVTAFVLAALSTAVSRRVAFRLNFLDLPQRHKAHSQPVPLLGGCAIFLGILMPGLLVLALASLWASHPPSYIPAELAVHIAGVAAKAPQALGILAAALGMHVLGIVDDRKHLGPWIKLIVQVLLAAAVVVFFNVRVLTLAGPTVSIAASVVWIVVITNAFNFLDNMDGLSAGVAAICAAALMAAAASMGQLFVTGWLCLILGSLLGFLPFNFSPARTFMGDAGSLVIGFLLAVASCLTTYIGPESRTHYSVLAPLLVMAVPLYDSVSVILLRVRERQNPMVGDRRHFSHRLVKRGMSTRAAVLTIYLCTAGTAIAATLLPRVDQVGAILIFAQTLAILAIIALLERGDAKP